MTDDTPAPRADLVPGTLEMLILRTLTLGSLHGYGVAQHIGQLSQGVLKVEQGSLYPALERLLKKGWVTAKWGPSPTGRRARYYTITASGRKHLDKRAEDYDRVVDAIARVMGGSLSMSIFDGLRHRVYVLLNRERYEEERVEEMLFHARMSGIDGAIRRSASAEGDPSRSHGPKLDHQNLGSPMMPRFLDALTQHMKYALRGIRRAPGFASMIVVTLGLGVGANAAMLSVLNGIFGNPSGVSQPETLRRLYVAAADVPADSTPSINDELSYPSFTHAQDAIGDAATIAGWTEADEQTVTVNGAQQTVHATWVTSQYFSVLGVDAGAGRLFAPEEAEVSSPTRVVVVSHDFWRRAAASDPGIVGSSLMVNDTTYTVIGVAAEGFRGVDLVAADVFLPIGTYPGRTQLRLRWFEWGTGLLQVAARVPHAATDQEVTGRATIGYRSQPPITGYRVDLTERVISGPIVAALGPSTQNGAIPISVRTAGVAAVVLLIACANVACLFLVRSARRRREISVRVALGVSRAGLLSQLLIEGLLLASISGVLACGVGIWGGALLRRLLIPEVPWAQPTFDPRTTMVVMALAAASGLVAAFAPALHARRANIGAALRTKGQDASGGRSMLRDGLLVMQGALSVVLVVGSALFIRSLGELDALPIGYDVDQLIRVTLPSAEARRQPQALNDAAAAIASMPNVADVAVSSSAAMGGYSGGAVFIQGQIEPLDLEPTYNGVTREFFDVAGIAIHEGRTFDRDEAGAAIVNETMADLISSGASVIGTCIYLESLSSRGTPSAECTRIVGVSENARRREIVEDPIPQFFIPLAEGRGSALLIRFDRDPAGITEAVRAELGRTFDPAATRIDLMSAALAPQLRPWKLGAQLFTAFGLLALLVTAVGIYSVVAYSVGQRTHEMGVRIALGAKLRDVLGLVVGDGLRSVVLGAVVGIALALAMGKLIASLLYDVTPRDPVAMGAAILVLLLTGLIASLVPAWRAARVDPVRALAAE